MFGAYKNFEYYIFLPSDYKEGQEISLLIDLHGAGRRGRDLELLKSGALEKFLEEEQVSTNAVVIAPQCFAILGLISLNNSKSS